MDIHTRRRTKLEQLIQERGGILQRVADEAGVNERYLSQIRNSTRNMGSAFARKIEIGLGLPDDWFDIESATQPRREDIAAIVSNMSHEERMVWLRAIAEAEAQQPPA